MAASNKRPSVKGKKRARTGSLRAESVAASAPVPPEREVSEIDSDGASENGVRPAVEAMLPSDAAAHREISVEEGPDGVAGAAAGGSAAAEAPAASGDEARDAAVKETRPAVGRPSVRANASRREKRPAVRGDVSADPADGGSGVPERVQKKAWKERLSSSLAGLRKEPQRGAARDLSVERNASRRPDAPAPALPAGDSVQDGARGEERCPRSMSRKATEREKAILRGRKRRMALISAAAVCLAAAAIGGLVFWNTYLRYDDAADIQGQWQVADGSMTVVIDGSSIRMPESLSYEYAIDTWKKTISFSFADLSGEGTYRFSSDRSSLTVREGEGEGALDLSLVKISDDVSAEPALGDARVAEEDQVPAAEDADPSAAPQGEEQAAQESLDEGAADAAAQDGSDANGPDGSADAAQ